MYNSHINKSKRYDYAETERRIEQAHQLVTGQTLGDIKINLLIKHNPWLLSERMNQELKQYELSCTAYATLMMLYSTEGHTANPSDMCLCTGETRANMTRICDELVALNAVTRVDNPDDRRRVDLSLTSKGIELLKSVAPNIHTRMTNAYSTLDAEEKSTLEKLLLKLMKALE
jgi:MarR family transcriptional repressor of emrRAB